MNDKEKARMFDRLCENASPHIQLVNVVDDGGELLLEFGFHPQDENDLRIRLDIAGTAKDVMLSNQNLEDLIDTLQDFKELSEKFAENYREVTKSFKKNEQI